MVGALALGFEDDLQEASEIAGRPAFLLEPAEVFSGEFVERAAFEASEGHGPGAELFPVGGGLGGVHGGKDRAGDWDLKFPIAEEVGDQRKSRWDSAIHPLVFGRGGTKVQGHA